MRIADVTATGRYGLAGAPVCRVTGDVGDVHEALEAMGFAERGERLEFHAEALVLGAVGGPQT